MEKSASEPAFVSPTLSNEDYLCPRDGVGLTGFPKRVILGCISKDTGSYSSLSNQIIKRAGEVPGPGKYNMREYGKLPGSAKFQKSERTYKIPNQGPAPAMYERKDFHLQKGIAASEFVSGNHRVTLGKVSKSKKRSFLDQAIAHGTQSPGPGHQALKSKLNNRLDTNVVGVLDWSKGSGVKPKKGYGSGDKGGVGPNSYNINYASLEENPPKWTVPKALGQDFLEKALKQKWSDAKTKREVPGPGTYGAHTEELSKITRGTKYLQIRQLPRSPISGYF